MGVILLAFSSLLITATVCLGNGGIDHLLPTEAELGSGWTARRIVILIDPSSAPPEIADPRDNKDPERSLRFMRRSMRETDRQARAFIRYYRGESQYGVFISRFGSRASADLAWAQASKDTSIDLPRLQPIGERSQGSRDGMHNAVTFVRGLYCVTVEGGRLSAGWEDITKLATAIDTKLVQHSGLK